MMLSYAGSSSNPVFSETDENGRFHFVSHRTGKQDMIIQPYPGDDNYTINLDPTFVKWEKGEEVINDKMKEPAIDHLNESFIGKQVKAIYDPYFSNDTTVIETNNQSFYGKPSLRIFPERFIEIPNMTEIFKEIAPFVSVVKHEKRIVFQIVEDQETKRAFKDVMTLVDGVYIQDANLILNISPSDIKYIDVVNKNYFLKGRMLGPILAIYTRKADLSALDFDPHIFRIQMEGLKENQPFYSNDYPLSADSSSSLADYRNLLYWESGLNLSNEGSIPIEFFTSDATGMYTIRIEGYNKKLEKVSAEQSFNVVDK